ncbi:hypothetical protein ml_93 [Mollivirus sibericum]|uniref:hypothetical protein n=1 Tax=Mollivirus sibericum TaxID=1678078 RepID=UPI0006B2DD34|nr:hypothetical protein ml_93 [Mollivirus sibericum]ALD61895.1 hypothetical protein ml_93 [Mollivirus sibericum]
MTFVHHNYLDIASPDEVLELLGEETIDGILRCTKAFVVLHQASAEAAAKAVANRHLFSWSRFGGAPRSDKTKTHSVAAADYLNAGRQRSLAVYLDALVRIGYCPKDILDERIFALLRQGRCSNSYHARIKNAAQIVAEGMLRERFMLSDRLETVMLDSLASLLEAAGESADTDTVHQTLVPWMDAAAFDKLCEKTQSFSGARRRRQQKEGDNFRRPREPNHSHKHLTSEARPNKRPRTCDECVIIVVDE